MAHGGSTMLVFSVASCFIISRLGIINLIPSYDYGVVKVSLLQYTENLSVE